VHCGAPRSAADALVGLVSGIRTESVESRTKGSGANEDVPPQHGLVIPCGESARELKKMRNSVSNGWVSIRWVAIAVIALSSSLNFLDRQVLAALAPQLMREFRITAAQYGDVIFAFSVCYALAAPLAGLFIDRLGLRLGTSLAVAGWSLAGLTTGLTSTLGQLTLCRSVLGVAEAGGIPGTGKACAVYLKPQERAIGSGITQMGLSFGAIAAPILAEICSRTWGWRSAFMVAGALGFAWIPLWIWISGRAGRVHPEANGATPAARPTGRNPEQAQTPPATPVTAGAILSDPRYWAILVANVLSMLAYSLWVNWTTVFLVRVHHMPQHLANTQLAWIPPVFASAGGLFGGWLVMRWFDGNNILQARMKAILTSAVVLLATALVPLATTAGLATALICLSFFACVLGSVNIYSLPLDIFGSTRAAFAVSGLTSVYGLVQGAFSSIAGRVVEAQGFAPLCVVVALCPLGAWLVLRFALRDSLQKEMRTA
jgi:ACS family hexuronate transporter-like MFS transporter